MRMTNTNPENHKLLSMNLFKKERMIIRLKTKQGVDLESKIISGSRVGVSSQDEISKLIKDLLYQSLKKQLLVSEIQVVHTHQNHKIGSDHWRIGEFSLRDLECANYLKGIYRFPLRFIIVSKMEVSMEKLF